MISERASLRLLSLGNSRIVTHRVRWVTTLSLSRAMAAIAMRTTIVQVLSGMPKLAMTMAMTQQARVHRRGVSGGIFVKRRGAPW